MKLIVYKGNCASYTVFGIKFTNIARTASVSDELAEKFKTMSDKFDIVDVQKSDIIKDKKKDKDAEIDKDPKKEKDVEECIEADPDKVKKLMKQDLNTLREMCEAKGLDSSGTKQTLAIRLVSTI